MAQHSLNEVYFEIQSLGKYSKITAIDAHSGTEVTVSGPSDTSNAQLKKVALRKLEYVMKKKGLLGAPRP